MNFSHLMSYMNFWNGKGYAAIIFLILSSIYLSSCEPSSGKSTPPSTLLKVPVAKPLYKPITEWDEYTGRFRAVERVEVRARVSGYVEEVRFKDGDMVRHGDILFIIDQRPFKIALLQAEAQLQQAKAEQQQAQSAYDRVESLKDSRAISQEEFEQRRQALFVAVARVEAAQAQVDRARLELQFTEVRAPIAGRASENFITEGNLISGGSDQATLLTTIVSLDPIYFYFEGSESALLKYSRQNHVAETPGVEASPYRVQVKLLNEASFAHEGSIDFIDNEVDSGTGTFQGRALIPNPDFAIKPGMFGSARVLHNDVHETLLIPDAVVATDQSQKVVFVLADSNKVETRTVQLGPLHTGELRIVRSGITQNDQIIIGNIQKIQPGMMVEPEIREISDHPKN